MCLCQQTVKTVRYLPIVPLLSVPTIVGIHFTTNSVAVRVILPRWSIIKPQNNSIKNLKTKSKLKTSFQDLQEFSRFTKVFIKVFKFYKNFLLSFQDLQVFSKFSTSTTKGISKKINFSIV